MADKLAEAMATLTEKMTAFASTATTYRRGHLSCTINFTGGAEMLRVTNTQGGTKIERPDLSGTFDATELDFDDGEGQVKPKDGDVIEWQDGQYRVTPINSEPAWRFCNPQRTAIRIVSAKYIGPAE